MPVVLAGEGIVVLSFTPPNVVPGVVILICAAERGNARSGDGRITARSDGGYRQRKAEAVRVRKSRMKELRIAEALGIDNAERVRRWIAEAKQR